MTVISSIICPSSEEFLQVVFDQQGAPEYAQYLSHGPSKLEVVLDDCNEAVCDDGDMIHRREMLPHPLFLVSIMGLNVVSRQNC